MAMSDISALYIQRAGEDLAVLDIGRIQLDNQLGATPFPSMMYPLSPVAFESTRDGGVVPRVTPSLKGKPFNSAAKQLGGSVGSSSTDPKFASTFISLEIRRDFSYPGIQFIPFLRLNISPFDVNIDGAIIHRLINMASTAKDALNDASQFNVSPYVQPDSSSATARNMSSSIPSSSASGWAGTSSGLLSPRARASNKIGEISSVIHAAVSHQKQQDISNGGTGGAFFGQHSPRGSFIRPFNDHQEDDTYTETLVNTFVQRIMMKTASPRQLTQQPSNKIYLQRIEISDIRLNVSFNLGVNNECALGESLWSTALATVVMAIGSTLAKIDNCPLSFREFKRSDVFVDAKRLGKVIAAHYVPQATKQTLWIFLSLEALGNPVQMISSKSSRCRCR